MIAAEGGAFRWSDHRYRLISLLDVVKKIDFAKLFAASSLFGKREHLSAALIGKGFPAEIVEQGVRGEHVTDVFVDQLQKVGSLCEDAGLLVSFAAVKDLARALGSGKFTTSYMESGFGEVQRTIERELGLHVFLQIEASKATLYESPLDGWKEITEAFPSCLRDAEEASKCLALERHTASVFHCMRIAEVGLKALAESMDIPYEYKMWDPVLKKLAHIAETEYSKLEEKWRGQRQRFLDARERLTAIKDALRNPTMHVRGTYTDEMGEDVYRSVRSFMKNLSSWLSEQSGE